MNRLKNKQWIIENYVNKSMSIGDIAKLIGCSKSTVHRHLKTHNIESRTATETRCSKNSKSINLNDREWLIEQYIALHKTPETIAKENGCGATTVGRYLKKHEIEIRDVSNSKLKESLVFLLDKDWMYDKYIKERHTLAEIATELDCSVTAICSYLDKHNIARRNSADAICNISREKYKNTMLEKYNVVNGAQINTNNLDLLENRDWMYKKYIDENKTSTMLSRELCVDPTTICNYLRRLNIPITNTYNISTPEYKIRNFLDDHNIIYESSNRTLIKPFELDIFIPSCKIAIEVHGLYWHSELFKTKDYHENKRILCDKNGIRLIQLYEDAINTKWELIQRFLLNAIGISDDERIFARKCVINNYPNISVCKDLLNTHHIQGYAAHNKAITLEHRGDTVAVMLFKDNVLVRYATSKKVIGGFGKLLKASNISDIITFIDLDMFSGETYFKTGFVIDRYLKPDYKYIVNGKREHKFGFRLKKFMNDPKFIYENDKTEHELARMNKIYRIYDSGKYRLVWNIKKEP